jgi:DNA-binding NtrC family response regulator
MGRRAILLVDDEPDLLQTLSVAVGRACPSNEVIAASSAEEAQARLADFEADGGTLALALVDQVLGGGASEGGMALIRSVRGRYPNAPTFLFTGRATAVIEAEAQASGTRVLWKPLKLSALLDAVATALGDQAGLTV